VGVPVPVPDSNSVLLNKKIIVDTLSGSIEDVGGVFSHLQKIFPLYDWKSIKSNFDSINSYRYPLDSTHIATSTPLRLVTELEFYEACQKDTSFFMRDCYWTEFSRVGFDPSKNIALVFYNYGRSGGGAMNYKLLIRYSDKWRVLRTIFQPYT
jgi:hypothetical protein